MYTCYRLWLFCYNLENITVMLFNLFRYDTFNIISSITISNNKSNVNSTSKWFLLYGQIWYVHHSFR